ncbi:MAG TPA: ribosome biogenesis GTP-binding protein YihA/YsxC [Pseudohongiella sp.]|nr:ribosome biogenesis GTP-binding protein YihA/YsxC [Pseudohongiella sp.]
MNYQKAVFTISAAKLKDCPPDSIREVAFAGRSNAGKSSAINSLTRQSQLARASKTPGRTQLINFFAVDPGRYLVDLPGYGFAKVPLAVKDNWQIHLEHYLNKREALAGLVLVTDIRHVFKDFDLMMINWARQNNIPLHILLTKSDKLKRGAIQDAIRTAKAAIADLEDASVQEFSSLKKTGIEILANRLDEWLTPEPEESEEEVVEAQ